MITFFDMFAGVGGFRAGLERAGGYKMAGNAVTVNVVYALGLRLKTAHAASVAATRAEPGWQAEREAA